MGIGYQKGIEIELIVDARPNDSVWVQ